MDMTNLLILIPVIFFAVQFICLGALSYWYLKRSMKQSLLLAVVLAFVTILLFFAATLVANLFNIHVAPRFIDFLSGLSPMQLFFGSLVWLVLVIAFITYIQRWVAKLLFNVSFMKKFLPLFLLNIVFILFTFIATQPVYKKFLDQVCSFVAEEQKMVEALEAPAVTEAPVAQTETPLEQK